MSSGSKRLSATAMTPACTETGATTRTTPGLPCFPVGYGCRLEAQPEDRISASAVASSPLCQSAPRRLQDLPDRTRPRHQVHCEGLLQQDMDHALGTSRQGTRTMRERPRRHPAVASLCWEGYRQEQHTWSFSLRPRCYERPCYNVVVYYPASQLYRVKLDLRVLGRGNFVRQPSATGRIHGARTALFLRLVWILASWGRNSGTLSTVILANIDLPTLSPWVPSTRKNASSIPSSKSGGVGHRLHDPAMVGMAVDEQLKSRLR